MDTMADILERGDGKEILTGFDQAQLDALLQQGWRLTPATMAVKLFEGRWRPAKHLMYVSTIVSNAIHKGGQFIIVTFPPRHGKSEFLSVNTPIWHLETFPHKRIILASYSSDLATEFALKVRDAFQDEDLRLLLNTRLRKDKQRVNDFKTTKGGGMVSIGVGGGATGKGADLFLLDDFVKNAEEALSETQKKKNWDWLLSTAITRLEPGATIIVLATRWDKNDLIGMIIDKYAELEDAGFEPPTIINFPAIAEANDVLGREIGEPLWPERYDEKALALRKAMMGSYWWDALYQQRPRSSMLGANVGGSLKIIPLSEVPTKDRLKSIRAWDFAATELGGDWTAGPLMHEDKDDKKIYITDCPRVQHSPKKVEQLVVQTAEIDGPGVAIWIEQEPGSAGLAQVEHYELEVLKGWHVRGEKATGPVEVRCQPFLAAVEAGNVHLVKGGWNQQLRDEIDAFPEGDHDDILVACALGYRRLVRGRFGGVTWGRGRDGRRAPTTGRELPVKRLNSVVW